MKHYRGVEAVDDASFVVHRGDISGIVGPNGAGKTTTIECLDGLRRPDRGTFHVFCLDPLSDRVLIIDHGQFVALDTPQNLVDSLGTENRVVFEVDGPVDEGLSWAVPGAVRSSASESGWWSMGGTKVSSVG